MAYMLSRTTVEIGQRYSQLGAAGTVWVVVGISEDHAGNPHAQMVSEVDSTKTITIAFSALADKRLYRRLVAVDEGGGEQGN